VIVRFCLLIILIAGLWVLSGCNLRSREGNDQLAPQSMSTSSSAGRELLPGVPGAPGAPGALLAPKPRVLPALTSEPLVRVLLVQAASITFTLESSATLADGRRLASGTHRAQALAGTLVLDGVPVAAENVVQMPAAPVRFRAELDPPYGPRQTLAFRGAPVLRLSGAQAQLLEEVRLETYLAGVLPTEMNGKWPVAALAAQAIAARSYASAKYLERFDKPWQLHWHYSVDMAYAGASAKQTANVGEALRRTRGQVLMYRNLPVPALFNACSGGTTEAAANVWPTLSGADRLLSMTEQMPSVSDASAEAGAAALGMRRTHWRWKSNIPLASITRDLQAWARTHPEDKLAFGTVTGIAIESRNPNSGRVAQVAISHKVHGRTRKTLMSAPDFRMAISPVDIRSTWWDTCSVASAKGGVLVLSGRGFGHGVGLSQVSAWQMASEGRAEAAICARFYPSALIERRW
jgi:SpoIID/LytB domain protein